MADFPCPSERIAASALLLLSATTTHSNSRSIFDNVIESGDWMGEASKIRSCQGSLVSSYSKSSSMSLSELSDVSMEAISERSTAISTQSTAVSSIVSQRHEMNLKVVRRSRSKVQQVSGGWVYSSAGEASSMTKFFRSISESSCLTASAMSSSADSSNAQSRLDGYARRRNEKLSLTMTRKTSIGSAHIRRRAEGIMRMLCEGSSTEVTIRQVLGDSPDTSKALRMNVIRSDDSQPLDMIMMMMIRTVEKRLIIARVQVVEEYGTTWYGSWTHIIDRLTCGLLKLEKVKRSGTGGRVDPYIYRIAP